MPQVTAVDEQFGTHRVPIAFFCAATPQAEHFRDHHRQAWLGRAMRDFLATGTGVRLPYVVVRAGARILVRPRKTSIFAHAKNWLVTLTEDPVGDEAGLRH